MIPPENEERTLTTSAPASSADSKPILATTDDLADVFSRVSALMYRISGVNLTDGKRELVRARLSKRMRALGWDSFVQYVDFVESEEGRGELAQMVDTLTTNKTNFFRELPHFVFLREQVLPHFSETGDPLRIWSAGCSSGEEPYSLAMLLREVFPDLARRDVRILATDLSHTALGRARLGIYDEGQMEGVPPDLRSKYFRRTKADPAGITRYQVKEEIRSPIALAQLNLMERWPMKGPFHVILCRNVMIYFDRETRQKLIQRFTQLLPAGGVLMVGHSESLNGLAHDLKYVQPAVYRK